MNAICPGLVDTERTDFIAAALAPQGESTEEYRAMMIRERETTAPLGRVAQVLRRHRSYGRFSGVQRIGFPYWAINQCFRWNGDELTSVFTETRSGLLSLARPCYGSTRR